MHNTLTSSQFLHDCDPRSRPLDGCACCGWCGLCGNDVISRSCVELGMSLSVDSCSLETQVHCRRWGVRHRDKICDFTCDTFWFLLSEYVYYFHV